MNQLMNYPLIAFKNPTIKICCYALFVIAIYKLLTNACRYFRIKHLGKEHLKWLSDLNPTFPTYKKEIISLFKRAGIQNFSTPTTQAIGHNRVASFSADIFTNFPSTHSDIYNGAIRMFCEAEGVYRQRILETFSPVYWIELVIFAPKNLLVYLGFDENKALCKACNVLLSIIWWFFIAVLTMRKSQLKDLLIELLGNL